MMPLLAVAGLFCGAWFFKLSPFGDSANTFPPSVSQRSMAPLVLRTVHNFTFRNRSALPITETELKLIAAPAMMGLRSNPKNG